MTVMDNEDPADPSAHEPRVTGSPETIWLVYGELEHDDTHANCADSGEVTWCEDAQFPADVRYLRADLLYREAREIVAQEVAAERARWASRVDTMPCALPSLAISWASSTITASNTSAAYRAMYVPMG